MMRRFTLLALVTVIAPAVILGTVGFAYVVWVSDVARARRNAAARERYDPDCLAPCCDVGPDDLMDLAEAVGVARKPFALDVAVDTAIRDMPVDESTAWVATARDIGHLDTYDAAEWSR